MKKIIMLALALFTLQLIVRAEALETGTQAPSFSLPDINGKTQKLAQYKGKIVVLEWVNHGCPFVKKHYDSNNMQKLQKEYTGKGVVWLSVCSSAKGKQGYYEPKEWAALNKEKGSFATAVLLDVKGKVGRAYQAKTTPHMYIIGQDGILRYQGAIDSKPTSDPFDIPVSVNYVKQALDELLSGKSVSEPQTQSYGCSVKY